MHLRDLLIVGAGPAGLAAAIAAKRAGLDFQILEKGALVNSLLHFPTHMVFFTTAELLEIGGLPFVTPYEKPTRTESLRYYRRVVDTCGIDVCFGEEVMTIVPDDSGPAGDRLFAVETRSVRGIRRVLHASTVLIAIGAYDRPNLVGAPGEDLPHVHHYYKEPHPHFRQPVVVVGGKNSAAEAALDLYRSGAQVTIVHRRAQLGDAIKYWVRPDIENRIREGSIAARFETHVLEIRPTSVVVERNGERDELPAEAVFLMTGYLADTNLLVKSGIQLSGEMRVPEHDPETFETNVPNLFIAGTVVAGRQSGQIFIENGRFHGERVVEAIRRRISN